MSLFSFIFLTNPSVIKEIIIDSFNIFNQYNSVLSYLNFILYFLTRFQNKTKIILLQLVNISKLKEHIQNKQQYILLNKNK
jgi:archaellum biogenesis ATPase FlaH